MPYLELPDVRLWYLDTGGDGAPVVFLHAASGSSASWEHQWPAFQAAGYRCIGYDRRGWGRTQSTGDRAATSHFADDLDGLIDGLGLQRVHLVGVAAGGGPVLDYALLHPERARCVVVSDALCGVQDPDYLAFSQRIRPPEIANLPVHLRELSASYRGLHPDGVERWRAIEEATRAEGADQGGPQYYVRRQEYRNHVTLSLLHTFRTPALLIVGGADMTTPPAQMQIVADAIPNCRFEVLPTAGHASYWEQPEAWNRLVLTFLRNH